MTDETRDTGIPTRAIHEAYLGMQDAHRRYRQARDEAGVDESQAQAGFQDAVLTFYELVRPHLKHEPGLSEYWQGDLPEYPDQWWESVDAARQYCRQQGTAVWHCQRHTETAPTASLQSNGGMAAVADGGHATPAEWHDVLGLTDRQRVVAIGDEDDVLVWVELRANMGLQQLDTWQTRKRRERTRGSGFMSGSAATEVTLKYVAPPKLVQAKRLLTEVTDKLTLLSEVDFAEPTEAGGKYEDALDPDVSVEDLDSR